MDETVRVVGSGVTVVPILTVTVDFEVTVSSASVKVLVEVVDCFMTVVLVVGSGVMVAPISKVVVLISVVVVSASVKVVDVVCLSVETFVVKTVMVDVVIVDDVDVETDVDIEAVVDGTVTFEATKGVAET